MIRTLTWGLPRRAVRLDGRAEGEQCWSVSGRGFTTARSQTGFFTASAAVATGLIGIGLDVAHVREETAAAPFMKQMDVFDALLIDVRTFLRLRENPADKALAVIGLEALGFEIHKNFFAAGPLSWFRRRLEGGSAIAELP